MHAAGRRCPGRPAASYQPQPPRGSHGFHVRRSTNGTPHKVDVDGDTPLLWVLRDVLGMTGTKFGCGQALCGACTVHVDGAATRSCITTVDSIGESAITTIEAVGQAPQGMALQKVVQCGYCQSGQIMLAAALLKDTPKPTG
jgi:isoquinoline 1-oxidoreductase subunit alpha